MKGEKVVIIDCRHKDSSTTAIIHDRLYWVVELSNPGHRSNVTSELCEKEQREGLVDVFAREPVWYLEDVDDKDSGAHELGHVKILLQSFFNVGIDLTHTGIS